MADTSIFSRLQKLFSTDVIIRNAGGNELAGRASFSSAQYNWGANLQANSVTYNNIFNSETLLLRSSRFL